MPSQEPPRASGSAPPPLDVIHFVNQRVHRARGAQRLGDLLGEAFDANSLQIHYDHRV